MGQSGFHHPPQVILHIRRIRRGNVVPGIQHLIPYHSIDCRDQTGLDIRLQQDLEQQIAGGGFTIRPCHANDGQLSSGMSVKCCRQPCERMARVLHSNVRNCKSSQWFIPNNSNRPTLDRIRNEIMPIRRVTFHRHEQVAWHDHPVIKSDPVDNQVGEVTRIKSQWEIGE